MDIHIWFNLASPDDWVLGRDDMPIFHVVEDICQLAINIGRMLERIAKKLPEIEQELITLTPILYRLQSERNKIIAMFENLLISSFIPDPDENKEPEDSGETTDTDKIFDMVAEMKEDLEPQDVDARRVAEKLLEQKKNPIEGLKDTIKILKSNVDVQKYYKRTEITVNQIMDMLSENNKVITYIYTTLIFAKNKGGDADGLKKAVLFFIGTVPERVAVPVKDRGIILR